MIRTFMTILLLSLSASAASQAPATTSKELSKKLATGRFETVYDQAGNLTECRVTRSTGDADLDGAFCETARACVTGKPVRAGTGRDSCMDRKQAEIFDRIVAKRSGKKAPEMDSNAQD